VPRGERHRAGAPVLRQVGRVAVDRLGG
jgi:hypothetical protein